MTKTFKGKYVPFYIRLLKRLAPLFALVALGMFKLYYGSFSKERLVEFRHYALIFLAVCLVIGIYFHTNRIRTIVNEVRFSDTKLQIVGQDFTSKYEDSLDLSKTMLEIQLEELSKSKSRYCLEIYSEEKYYYLNKFNDWDYAILAQVVDEFQSRTGKSVGGMELYAQLA